MRNALFGPKRTLFQWKINIFVAITPLQKDPKQQELRVLFKASFDQGPYGGFFYRECEYNIGFIDLATEHVNIALVLST